MSQKSFLDNKKGGRFSICLGGWGDGSTNIWKIPYVSSFLFLKASLTDYDEHLNQKPKIEGLTIL